MLGKIRRIAWWLNGLDAISIVYFSENEEHGIRFVSSLLALCLQDARDVYFLGLATIAANHKFIPIQSFES